MNESYDIIETYIGVPTEFTLIVADNLGFVKNVVLHLFDDLTTLDVPYVRKIVVDDINYSVFQTFYTFTEKCNNEIALFTFLANDQIYTSELHYIVTSL